jgi:NAD(P)H dehydrogenase (quinone)
MRAKGRREKSMIVVTGATGQLGRLVIDELLKTTEAKNIIAGVRTPAKANEFADRGVQVREADYSRPETLATAFDGASRLLLISGSELGKREEQHKAVIDAAKSAGVTFVAYTSLLHCNTSPLMLAAEHLATERYLLSSGLTYSLLRNGWYFENQTAAIPQAIENGAFLGASGDGRFSAASRSDYAAAAATVLTGKGHEDTVLELGGDQPYTRGELASEVSRQTGKVVKYNNMSEVNYKMILSKFLPAAFAEVIADAEAHASKGALEDNSHTLHGLLGRPTTSLTEAVESAIRKPPTAH